MNKLNVITNTQDVFSMYVCVPAGGIYEHPSEAGISHVLEHMFLTETRKYSAYMLAHKIAELGGIVNATTDKDMTCYYIYTVAENWKQAIDIFASIINDPHISNKAFENEKNVIVEEINMRKDNYLDFYNSSIDTIMPSSNPYSNHVEGTADIVVSLTKKDLLNYAKRTYKDYTIVCNVVMQTKSEVESYLLTKFGPNTAQARYPRHPKIKFHQKAIMMFKDKEQYTHTFTFPAYRKAYIKENAILNFIRFAFINGNFRSKLMYTLRNKLGLIYGVSSSNNAYRHLGIFSIELSTSQDKLYTIVKKVKEILIEIKTNGLSASELKYYKKAFLNNKKLAFADESTRTAWHAENIFYGIDVTENQYKKIIHDITNIDIINTAKHIFDFKKMGFLTYGKYKKAATNKNLNIKSEMV